MKPQLTIEAFADWCEKQPANREFDVTDPKNCAVAQFGKMLGFAGSTSDFQLVNALGHREQIAGLVEDDVYSSDLTFGALAKRLRASL